MAKVRRAALKDHRVAKVRRAAKDHRVAKVRRAALKDHRVAKVRRAAEYLRAVIDRRAAAKTAAIARPLGTNCSHTKRSTMRRLCPPSETSRQESIAKQLKLSLIESRREEEENLKSEIE